MDFETSEIPQRWVFDLDLGFNTQDDGGLEEAYFTLAAGAYQRLIGILGLGGVFEVFKDFSLDVEKKIEAMIPTAFV